MHGENQAVCLNRFSNIRALPNFEWTRTRWPKVTASVQYYTGESSERSGYRNVDVVDIHTKSTIAVQEQFVKFEQETNKMGLRVNENKTSTCVSADNNTLDKTELGKMSLKEF